MALALDASTPAFVKGTSNPVTTASFSPPATALIIVFAEADENNTFSISNTGGLSFTSINQLNTASGSATNSLGSWWAHTSTAPGSMTVSVTKTGSFTGLALKVLVFTGAESSFTGAHNAVSSNTLTLTMTQTGSWGWAAVGDNNNSTTDAAGTGCTWNDAEASFGTGGIAGGILKRTSADGTSGAGTTLSAGSAASNMSVIAVEVKAAGGSTVNASATLTETATLTASPTQGFAVSAGLTETATLAASPTDVQLPSSTLTETATLTASPIVSKLPAAALTETVTLTASPTLTQNTSAIMTETATLTASSGSTISVSATLTETATLTGSPTDIQLASAPMTETATLTASPTLTQNVAATFTETATVTAAATRAVNASAGLTETVTLTANATGVFNVSATLTESATITASPTSAAVTAPAAPVNPYPGNPYIPPTPGNPDAVDDWRAFIFETTSGTYVAELPLADIPTWSYGLNNPAGGSVNVALGGDAGLDKTILDQYTDNQNWRWSIGVAYNGVILQAGPIVGENYTEGPSTSISFVGIWKLFTRRVVLNPSGNVATPTATTSDITYTGVTLRQLAKLLIRDNMISQGQLPIDLPDDDIPGSVSETYYGYDLTLVSDALTALTVMNNGPEIEFRPYWVDPLHIRWSLRTGSPRLGQLGAPWTYDYGDNGALIGLDKASDASMASSGVYVRGSGSQRAQAIAFSQDLTAVNAGAPMLLTIDGNHTSETSSSVLSSYASAGVSTYKNTIRTYNGVIRLNGCGVNMRRTGSPTIGDIGVGDTVRAVIVNHHRIPDSTLILRIIAIQNNDAMTARIAFQTTS